MKNKKSLIFLVAILVLGVSTTFAFFTGVVDINNLFTAAVFDNVGKEVFTSPSNWGPGVTTTKEVSVENNGNTPSRVRISITEEWKDKNGNVLPLVYNGEKVAIINLSNTEDWIKSGNYYYYNKDLNGGEETSLFMESVTFNPNYKGDIECTLSNDGHSNTCLSTGNLYDGGTYQLNVYIEMVQANVYESVWGVLASDISNPSEFIVLLDTDGGLSSSYKTQATVGQTYNLPTPAKTGYVFKGWYKDNLFTEKVENTDTVDLNSDTTFYAKFVPLSELTYSVAFATDDINCPLGSSYQTIQNANYGEIVSYNATPNPECIGYTFNGWNASNNISLNTAKYGITSVPETPWVNGNKGTYFKALQDNGEDVTLTALWSIHSNSLVIKPEGGSVSIESPAENITVDTTKTQNYNTTLTIGKPTKANSTSTSSKWTVSYNTSGGSTAPASEDLTRTIVTSYAFNNWTTSGTCGTLSSTTDAGVYTFPADDGTTCTITATYTSSVASDTADEITLPAAPTKEGYTFTGWKAGNTTKQPGEKYTPTADTTFTAQWTIVNYTISYTLNSGSITGEVTSYNIETNSFTLPAPTRTGYTFTGWTGTNGSTPQTTVTITTGSTGDRSYTANWSINTNTLTVNPNGGTVAFDGANITTSTSKTQDYNTTINYGKPSRENSSASAGSYSVSYSANGGSSTPGAQSAARTTTTSYTFSSWGTSGTCGTLSSTTNSGTYTYPANSGTTCTMTANWATSPSTTTAAVTLASAIERAGYIFAGWKSSTDNVTYSAGTSYTPTADTTFTAQWTLVNYSISYTLNSGSISGQPTSYNIETATFTLPTPTRTNYTFTGWTGSNGSTPQATVTITTGSTGDKTYTANWKQNGTNAVTLVKSKATKIDNDFYIYTGASPANYVKFNNQTWRILGVYKDKVKLINIENKLTSQVYNSSASSNVWSTSTMKTTLNGTYYSGLTQDAKNMIVQGEWNAGAAANNENASTSYTNAKGTKLTTSSLVGTMAAYEYLYAADSSCWSTSGNGYYDGCSEKDWLYTGSAVWTLSPNSNYSGLALRVNSSAYVGYDYVYSRYDVLPAVYLDSSVLITGGDGTTSNTAYELKL